jgi:hypothetical protein
MRNSSITRATSALHVAGKSPDSVSHIEIPSETSCHGPVSAGPARTAAAASLVHPVPRLLDIYSHKLIDEEASAAAEAGLYPLEP